MWEELGIAPTADPKAIRRAYASRLRGLDPDRDPAAFQRLRQAFERALVNADHPADGDRGQSRSIAPPPPIVAVHVEPVAEPEASPPVDLVLDPIRTDDLRMQAVRVDFQRALAAGETEAAFRHLMEASATGLLPLTDEGGIVAEFMAVAVDDRRLSGERFCFMAHHLGWDWPLAIGAVGNSDLREKVATRLGAEAWYTKLHATAIAKNRWLPTFLQTRWLARILLGMTSRWLLHLINTEVIHQLLMPYDAFEPWLGDRIDARRMALLRSAMRSGTQDSFASICWALYFVAFILVMLGLLFVTKMADIFSPLKRIVPTDRSQLGLVSLAWQDVQQLTPRRRAPGSMAMLRKLLIWWVRICFFILIAAIGIGLVVAAILFPPLAPVLMVAGFVARRSRKKRKR